MTPTEKGAMAIFGKAFSVSRLPLHAYMLHMLQITPNSVAP